MYKNTRFKIVGFCIYILDFIIPKNGKSICVSGNGLKGINGNALAILPHLLELKGYSVYVVSTTGESYPGVIVINPKTIKGLVTLMRSRVALITHGAYDLYWPILVACKHRLIINLWHGGIVPKFCGTMYERKIGKTAKVKDLKKLFNKTVNVCISEFDRTLYSACYEVPYTRFIITGYPRHDYLIDKISNKNSISKEKNIEVEGLVDKIKNKTVILYAPTYQDKESYLENLKGYSTKDLEVFLESNNAVFLVRRHINDQNNLTHDSDFIIDCGNDLLSDIVFILPFIDILISDFSTIVTDFILLNKPIIALIPNYEKYADNRGLLYDIRPLFPGRVTSNYENMKLLIFNYLENPELDVDIRSRVLRQSHKYIDGNSSKRVIDFLLKNIGK
jgi:CDP-glycerol glycerophosphotransferase